jgi:hypothetical protein
MKEVNKQPTSITLFAGDFDFVFNAVSRAHGKQFKDTEQAPPPLGGLTFNGIPLQRGRAK